MYEKLEIYIKKTKKERQKHLNLSNSCIEIGGDSRLFRGILAHYLKTIIDCKKYTVFCCHACNNSKCSNPEHLYWGTPKDNFDDMKENNTYISFSEATKKKYGCNDYIKMQKVAGRKGGLNGGGSNKLSKLIIETRLLDYRNLNKKCGYIKQLSEKWNISHTQVRRFIKKYDLK